MKLAGFLLEELKILISFKGPVYCNIFMMGPANLLSRFIKKSFKQGDFLIKEGQVCKNIFLSKGKDKNLFHSLHSAALRTPEAQSYQPKIVQIPLFTVCRSIRELVSVLLIETKLRLASSPIMIIFAPVHDKGTGSSVG